MAKIILHTGLSLDSVNEKRLWEDFKLSHKERMEKAFNLMKLSLLFSKDKSNYKKRIILK